MQTSRFTVRADSKQNSGLVNFVPEQRLPFVKISFIYRKRPRRRETGIKGSFEEMEQEFPFETFRPEKNRTTLSDVPLFPERPKKSCSIYFPTGFSEYFLYMVNNQNRHYFSKGFDKQIITWKTKTKKENLFSLSLRFWMEMLCLIFAQTPIHGKLVTLCHPAKANIQFQSVFARTVGFLKSKTLPLHLASSTPLNKTALY